MKKPVVSDGEPRQIRRRIRVSAWLVGSALAIAQAWFGRRAMNADGVSYLEIADGYLRGDWRAALNAYWSPLYSWALAVVKLLARPFHVDEFVLAHLFNVLVFAAVFACFERLLFRLARLRTVLAADAPAGTAPVPTGTFLMVGYAVFLWSSIALIGMDLVTPDLALAGLVYLSFSLLLDLRLGGEHWRTFVGLGASVGFGYLAKAPMFILAPCFFVVGVLLTRRGRRLRAVVAMSLVYAAIAGPFVLALSIQKGRLTFGDSGRLNYAWFVNGVPARHWQGGGPDGIPAHPSRRIVVAPPVYEFGTPIAASYAYWYDPSYWYEGVRVRFDPARQLAQGLRNLDRYSRLFFNIHARTLFRQGQLALLGSPLLLLTFLFGFALERRPKATVSRILASWFLLVPSIAGLALLGLVHIESRLVAAYAVVLYLSLWAAVRIPARSESIFATLCTALGFFVCLFVAADLMHYRLVETPTFRPMGDLAKELRRSGIGRGDKIASLDYSNRAAVELAHQAGVRIVAEIYEEGRRDDEDLFWQADAASRRRVADAFSDAGAVAILARDAPVGDAGWVPIGTTGFRLYALPREDRRQRGGQPVK